MAKITNEPSLALNSEDYLKSAGFLFEITQGDVVTVVGIKEGDPLVAKTFSSSQAEELANWIERNNKAEYNVYFHVNILKHGVVSRKAKKSDIAAIRAYHVDVDDPSENALERLKNFPIPPTCILFSGGGYQAFWLLKAPLDDIVRAEATNAAIAEALGGDNCHNADRIMRAPWTINWPGEKKCKKGRVPAKACLVEDLCDFSRTYSPEEFIKFEADAQKGDAQLPGLVPTDFPMVSITDLGLDAADPLAVLIATGDDPERPRGSKDARFPSRSEAYFSVCCSLARQGREPETIAGILVNPANGISEAVLEKGNPREHAYWQAEKAIALVTSDWPDKTSNGVPKPTFRNAIYGLSRLGITFENDTFHNRKRVGGHLLQEFQGDLTDDLTTKLRKVFIDEFRFDPLKFNLQDAVQTLCVENSFNPISDYLNSIEWDGHPRLETWLIDYMGAEDTPLHRAIGRIMLVAAVRRVRSPGCKFDTMVVLEGGQGTGKSTALMILAGEENFSDQSLFGQSPQQQAEALEGVWIFEVAELSGLKHTDMTHVKSFLSRCVDQLRPAYARFKERWLRRCILVGTTNDDTYLKDETGNRRFWPVKTGQIDLEGLKRDRNLLWAEAAALEADDCSITLPPHLWEAAADAQSQRMPSDPWDDLLANAKGDVQNNVERLSTKALFGEGFLNMPASQQQDYHNKRLGAVMRRLGWEGPKTVRFEGASVRGYSRKVGRNDDSET